MWLRDRDDLSLRTREPTCIENKGELGFQRLGAPGLSMRGRREVSDLNSIGPGWGLASDCRLCCANPGGAWTLTKCPSSWQVEWIQQQVVKKRTKRDYDFSRAQPTYFNDPKWPSMWYMVRRPPWGSVVQGTSLGSGRTQTQWPGTHHMRLLDDLGCFLEFFGTELFGSKEKEKGFGT